MKKIIFFVYLMSACYSGFGQHENKKWYFGANAGLDFMTNPPTILTNGAMSTFENSSSISDASGNLLFYTNGVTVWNKQHVVMSNGTGLMGDPSACQSGWSVRQPGSSTIYYIFTLDETGGPDGLRYSIVDMSLASGLGAVTTKNTLLHSPSSEKLTVTRHCNGTDLWIVSHDFNSANFRSYLLTSAGLGSPVFSNVGTYIGNSIYSAVGDMKISPNGKKLALAIYLAPCAFELYDFDPSTGVVSNSLTLATSNPINYPAGVEFSPDGSKLYGCYSDLSSLLQWDLCAGSNTAIIASVYSMTASGTGLMHLGPNGKIYVSRGQMTLGPQTDLGVVNNPNAPGAACNYVDKGQSIAPNTSQYGLPQMLNYRMIDPFTYTAACSTHTFLIPATSNMSLSPCSVYGFSLSSLAWNFGDPASGPANTSSAPGPVHVFSAPGTYTAQLILYYTCGAANDTLKQSITVSGVPLSVSGKTTVCKGEKTILTATGADTFSWSSSAVTTTFAATVTGNTVYTVTGTNTLTGCKATKTVSLTSKECVSVSEQDDEGSLRIYPNPAMEKLYVDVTSQGPVIIYDAFGKQVLKKYVDPGSHTLNIEELPAGIYFIMARQKDTVIRTKFIKEN